MSNPRATAILFLIGLAIGCTLVGIAAFLINTVVGMLVTGTMAIVVTNLLAYLVMKGGGAQ